MIEPAKAELLGQAYWHCMCTANYMLHVLYRHDIMWSRRSVDIYVLYTVYTFQDLLTCKYSVVCWPDFAKWFGFCRTCMPFWPVSVTAFNDGETLHGAFRVYRVLIRHFWLLAPGRIGVYFAESFWRIFFRHLLPIQSSDICILWRGILVGVLLFLWVLFIFVSVLFIFLCFLCFIFILFIFIIFQVYSLFESFYLCSRKATTPILLLRYPFIFSLKFILISFISKTQTIPALSMQSKSSSTSGRENLSSWSSSNSRKAARCCSVTSASWKPTACITLALWQHLLTSLASPSSSRKRYQAHDLTKG